MADDSLFAGPASALAGAVAARASAGPRGPRGAPRRHRRRRRSRSTPSTTSPPTRPAPPPMPSTRRSPPASDPGPLAGVPVAREGQPLHHRHPHHLLVADPRGLGAAVRRHRRRAPGRGRRGHRRQDQPRRVRHGLVDGELGLRPHPQPATTPAGCPVARPAAAPRRWPRGSPRSRSGSDTGGSIRQPAVAVRRGRREADLRARSAGTGSSPSRRRSTRSGRSPPRSPTPRCCWRSIAGHDPRDATSIPRPAPTCVEHARRRASTACASGSSASSSTRGRRTPTSSPASATRPRPSAAAGRQGRGGVGPGGDLRPVRLLPDRPGRGVEQPRPLRRRALRPAGRRPDHQRDDGRHPHRRLRRRGEAAHHARHLRPVRRLLRRLLRQGPEGPHADQPRLRRRLRAVRRAAVAHLADDRVRRSATRPPTRSRCT